MLDPNCDSYGLKQFCSENCGNNQDKDIDRENRLTNDFLILKRDHHETLSSSSSVSPPQFQRLLESSKGSSSASEIERKRRSASLSSFVHLRSMSPRSSSHRCFSCRNTTPPPLAPPPFLRVDAQDRRCGRSSPFIFSILPPSIVSDEVCAACDFNHPGKTCLRKLEWAWDGETFMAKKSDYYHIKKQIESDFVDGANVRLSKSFLDLSKTEQQSRLKDRLKKYCQKIFERKLTISCPCVMLNVDVAINNTNDQYLIWINQAKSWSQILSLLTSTSEVYGDPLQHPQKEIYWSNVDAIVRIFAHQICTPAPGTSVHYTRKFYENLVPSYTVYKVKCPDHLSFSSTIQKIVTIPAAMQKV
ncbi:hypothetical protein Ahy_B10g103810 isoform C [Arachis hypogaea]|nr:hypothetical protein Ahy_B10g103810 isoform C [Arachis hypogaea]